MELCGQVAPGWSNSGSYHPAHTHTALAANDGVEALAGAKSHGTAIELRVTDVVMPNLANWRRNSLDCVRKKNCCSFLVMPARLGSTIKSGTLRPIFSRNPDHSGSNSNRPKSRLRPNEFPHSPRCATMRWIDRHLRRPYNQAARAPHESFNHP